MYIVEQHTFVYRQIRMHLRASVNMLYIHERSTKFICHTHIHVLIFFFCLCLYQQVDLPASKENLIELRKLVKSLQEDAMSESEVQGEGVVRGGVKGMFEVSMASGQGLEQAVIALRQHIVKMKK